MTETTPKKKSRLRTALIVLGAVMSLPSLILAAGQKDALAGRAGAA